MTEYQKPEFVEVRMDAEIGAYQADPLDPPFASPAPFMAGGPGALPAETSPREE
jgi:hypothetical protein